LAPRQTNEHLPTEIFAMIAIGKRFLLGSLAWLAAGFCAPAAEPIPPEQFARVQTLIKPGTEEDRWASIPWLTDLWQARQIAAAQGKPILLWEMDGHPLGCT
jgi:hypothetical protein